MARRKLKGRGIAGLQCCHPALERRRIHCAPGQAVANIWLDSIVSLFSFNGDLMLSGGTMMQASSPVDGPLSGWVITALLEKSVDRTGMRKRRGGSRHFDA
jgi:hypothetical protein